MIITTNINEYLLHNTLMTELSHIPEDIIKEIKAVTAEEIKFVAERIFKDEGLNLAIVGKFNDDKEFKEILHF